MAREKRFSKKEWSWIMYDWANSVYATNIMAAIYPTIFASTIPGGDIRWGYGTSIATFIVAILAPFLGAVADYKGMKKKLFTLFALLGIVFTPLMAALGSWKLCLVGYVVSRIGFSGSCLFYDSFLTDVTTDERMDHVSSWGYAMGYIGGSTIPFVLSIAMLLFFDYNRFSQVFSVLIVSAWWALFSIPFFRNVKQEHYVEKTEPVSPARIFRNVIGTFKEICLRRGLLFFVIAYFFYIDGVNTVISISTAYGSTLGLGSTGMILALLVTQFVAFPSAIIYGKLAGRVGTLNMILVAVAAYMGIVLFAAFFLKTAFEFWVLAILVGLFQGGVQALSRSYFGRIIPKEKSNEYYGFFDIFGRYASVMGTFLVSVVTSLTANPSLGVLSIGVLLVVGFVLLVRLSHMAQAAA